MRDSALIERVVQRAPGDRYCVNPEDPADGFYVIEQVDDEFRWVWVAVTVRGGTDFETGPWLATRAEALDHAASDWAYVAGWGHLTETLRSAARAEATR